MTAGKAKRERTVLQLLALSRAAVGCKHKYPSQTHDRHTQVWQRPVNILRQDIGSKSTCTITIRLQAALLEHTVQQGCVLA